MVVKMSEYIIKSKVTSTNEVLKEFRIEYQKQHPFITDIKPIKEILNELCGYIKKMDDYVDKRYNEERDLWQDKGPAQIA